MVQTQTYVWPQKLKLYDQLQITYQIVTILSIIVAK